MMSSGRNNGFNVKTTHTGIWGLLGGYTTTPVTCSRHKLVGFAVTAVFRL